ncbi:MAG TPA: hypothetical protein VLJ61_03490 [Pyrinomonadaceae bacterium]|nr:hypothetical protein [Pyrinomonadaceae bacterium]
MSAVLKFDPRRKRQPTDKGKTWLDALVKAEARTRAEIEEYARLLAEQNERIAAVTEHARKLGEHALLLQEQECARVQSGEANAELERAFRELAEQWIDETEHTSNINKAILHPAYQQIIGMGKVLPSFIVPLLLQELEQNPDHWLVALHEITKEDPAPEDSNFEEAVEAWLNWGRSRGYLTEARA